MSQSIAKEVVRVSDLAENLKGSEIIKIAAEINERIKQGEQITNLTIGDFDPKIFPLPGELREEIAKAYDEGHTNYPQANGMLQLREAISAHISRRQGLNYSSDEVLVSGGARPVIYATFKSIVNRGDKIIFPIPSWNNNHYTYLNFAEAIEIDSRPENKFLPVAADLRPHLSSAAMVALCSPLNPTGTSFTEKELGDICDLILEENSRRQFARPLYLMYDQIYNALTLHGTKHVDPVSLRPAMRPYTIYIDGISKVFAATGIRVGWAFGPSEVISKMKALLSHIGAWSPKPEQIATARVLERSEVVDRIIDRHRGMISERIDGLYSGFLKLKEEGFPVDVIHTDGALYLTVKIDLIGRETPEGSILNDAKDVTMYLIKAAKMGIVPFYCFGASRQSPWFRISVGTLRSEDMPVVLDNLKHALGYFRP